MSKLAVVTGCNRGIGLEITKQLKAKGFDIIAVCRQPSAELQELGLKKIITDIDLKTRSGIQKACAALKTEKIDLLVNNAGIMERTSLEDFNSEKVIDQFLVNSLAPVELTINLTDSFNSGAKVAMITSRMGSISDNDSGGAYGYRMSKAALNAASKSLAIDLKPKDVAVALLHPGWVKTDMTNQTGHVEPHEAASQLLLRIEDLNIENSGTFWHANGEELPW